MPAAPPAQDGPGVSASTAALTVIGNHGGRRGRQLVTAAAAAQVAWPAVKWIWERTHRREDFTIVVAGTDPVYVDLHEWVLERIPQDSRKALIAVTGNGTRHPEYVSDDPSTRIKRPIPRIKLRYDGERTQFVDIDGHRVRVQVGREEFSGRENLSENWRIFLEKITFTATDPAGRDAVIAMINGILAAKAAKPGPPPLYMPGRWGGSWNQRADLPPRNLSSVILKKGQLERIVDDLERFLLAESEYNRLCQPWHRGYVFHGPPGTGKTSVARALADHFDMPVYYLPLGELDKETDLTQLVGGIEPRSMLLIEDVDAFHALTSRDEQPGTTNISTMLNALDGVWTPHGLVTVMTTNNLRQLDRAILRKGRTDVHEEFSLLSVGQARRLAEWFGAGADVNPRDFKGKSPADMIQTMREGR